MSAEKSQVLATLETHRQGLRRTLDGVSEADAVARPTVSALCLGGIVKHVSHAEEVWVDFVVDGVKVDDLERYGASFVVEPGEAAARLTPPVRAQRC